MIFGVVNESGIVADADVRMWVSACAAQLQIDAGPAWSRTPTDVLFYASRGDVPSGAGLFVVAKSSGQQGAEAWHTEAGGLLQGVIGVEEAQADGVPPSVDLSHEILEAFFDPWVNASVSDLAGKAYDLEVCDPVQDTIYVLAGVTLSGFVLPSWCDTQAMSGPFDRKGVLSSPFQISAGGYAMYTDAQGGRHQLGKKPPRRMASLRSFRRARLAGHP